MARCPTSGLKDGSPVAGGNEAQLTLPEVLLADAGNYALVASNTFGMVTTRAAALTLSATPVTIDDPSSRAMPILWKGNPSPSRSTFRDRR